MREIITFILENVYVLFISLVSFIVYFLSAGYLLKNRKTDFSYSGHEIVWFEGSFRKLVLSILGLAVGISAIMVCLLYLIVKVNI